MTYLLLITPGVQPQPQDYRETHVVLGDDSYIEVHQKMLDYVREKGMVLKNRPKLGYDCWEMGTWELAAEQPAIGTMREWKLFAELEIEDDDRLPDCPKCGAEEVQVDVKSSPGYTGAPIFIATYMCCNHQEVDDSEDNLEAAR